MRLVWQLALVAGLTVTPALAQTPAAPSDPLAAALKRQFDGVARNVKEAAEKTPDNKFSFQATKDVRTFAGFVGHVAASQYGTCARAKGVDNPNKEDLEKVTSKAALVKAITAANEFCSNMLGTANDKWLLEMITVGQAPNQTTVPRLVLFTANTSHSNEHYGNLVTYMRLNGLVPPSTERAQAPRPTQ